MRTNESNKVTLPYSVAVSLAALENYERDLRNEIFDPGEDSSWQTNRQMYRDEAEYLFREFKENYLPEDPDHHHIFVS
jgi:hypothetical protein